MSLHDTAAAPRSDAPGSQTSLRAANQQRVIEAVRGLGTVTQARIARHTALAPSTVSSIVHDLIAAGVLSMDTSHGGRRGQLVGFSQDAGLVAGLDVGHRHVTVAVADLNQHVRARRRHALPADHGLHDVLSLVRSDLADIRTELGVPAQRILAAGLTLPAPVDLDGRLVSAGAILPAWADTDVAAAASDALELPVVVENDANAGAIGEFTRGAGRGVANMAYVKLGHGVGTGLVLAGELFRGAHGSAGELGHMTVDERGELCRCGNRGCLETFASTDAVLRQLGSTRPAGFTVDDLVDAALAGDVGCARVIGDTGRTLGVSVANLCNVLNPELVVIGGELARADELLLAPLRDIVSRYGVQGCTRHLTIATAELGAEAPLVGALIQAADSVPLPV